MRLLKELRVTRLITELNVPIASKFFIALLTAINNYIWFMFAVVTTAHRTKFYFFATTKGGDFIKNFATMLTSQAVRFSLSLNIFVAAFPITLSTHSATTIPFSGRRCSTGFTNLFHITLKYN